MPKAERVAYNAYEAITISTVSVGFTAGTVGANNTHAAVTVETDQVRYRVDGTAPTSSEGHLLESGDTLLLDSQDQLQNVRFIRVTNDATVRCSYGLAS